MYIIKLFISDCNKIDETTTSSQLDSITSLSIPRTTTTLGAPSRTNLVPENTIKNNNKHQSTKEALESAVIGLIVAVAVVAILILLVIGYMVKQKLFRK